MKIQLPDMGCRACINRTWRTEGRTGCQPSAGRIQKEEAKKITEEQIVDKINTPGRGESHKHAKGGIVVKGMDDVAVRFSRCCAPVPGDEIVGYITRGRGSIHSSYRLRKCPLHG